ncbi:MAG: dephospho-CoA kinase [Gemmatimonadetes bacterium]|nr:dephospho-CoA kinase [Gemmatimonadota bacterium]
MISVGLTGNVGSGKSTVAELWSAAGVPVVSADDLSREAVLPGTPGLAAVRAAFGDGVLGADGTLDRTRLRAVVFQDAQARARLEGILHPLIAELRARWIDERRRAGDPLVVSEVPLLFERGLERDFDVTVLVDAPEATRLERLVHQRGIDASEARRIMAAQMDPARKRAAADHVIDNGGSRDHLEQEAARVLASLRGQASGGGSIRLDLHLHTRGSHDCLTDPEAVLARALSLGYARIAITDHNRLGVALAMAERHPDRIIPGEEVKTAEGIDVIGLYLSEEIPKGTPARETIRRIGAQGGVSYLPHPYAPGKGGGGRMAEELAPLCDVVEVFNARLHSAALNRRAEDLATRCGKLHGAGSDAHTVGEIGNAFVELPPHANRADAFVAALARARVGGTSASQLVHLASTWAKVRKKLPGGRAD